MFQLYCSLIIEHVVEPRPLCEGRSVGGQHVEAVPARDSINRKEKLRLHLGCGLEDLLEWQMSGQHDGVVEQHRVDDGTAAAQHIRAVEDVDVVPLMKEPHRRHRAQQEEGESHDRDVQEVGRR